MKHLCPSHASLQRGRGFIAVEAGPLASMDTRPGGASGRLGYRIQPQGQPRGQHAATGPLEETAPMCALTGQRYACPHTCPNLTAYWLASVQSPLAEAYALVLGRTLVRILTLQPSGCGSQAKSCRVRAWRQRYRRVRSRPNLTSFDSCKRRSRANCSAAHSGTELTCLQHTCAVSTET